MRLNKNIFNVLISVLVNSLDSMNFDDTQFNDLRFVPEEYQAEASTGVRLR